MRGAFSALGHAESVGKAYKEVFSMPRPLRPNDPTKAEGRVLSPRLTR